MRHTLPAFAGQEDVAHTRCAVTGFHRQRPLLPEITHGLPEAVIIPCHMSAIEDTEDVIVTRKFQSLIHLLI